MGILDFFNKKENKDKYIKWLKKTLAKEWMQTEKNYSNPTDAIFIWIDTNLLQNI